MKRGNRWCCADECYSPIGETGAKFPQYGALLFLDCKNVVIAPGNSYRCQPTLMGEASPGHTGTLHRFRVLGDDSRRERHSGRHAAPQPMSHRAPPDSPPSKDLGDSLQEICDNRWDHTNRLSTPTHCRACPEGPKGLAQRNRPKRL
jgi:hypothetical protein